MDSSLSLCLSVSLSLSPSILSIYLSIHLSIYISLFLSLSLSLSQFLVIFFHLLDLKQNHNSMTISVQNESDCLFCSCLCGFCIEVKGAHQYPPPKTYITYFTKHLIMMSTLAIELNTLNYPESSHEIYPRKSSYYIDITLNLVIR